MASMSDWDSVSRSVAGADIEAEHALRDQAVKRG